ncbi:alpha,alpha-phosphotrehalase [Haloferax sp. MBLA0076]|uniref:Alpha,alpha-phosphotrehalase n=1 Tax=Haloferax litoreum TaxID=2666140 RepID=A0A6A8GKK9_9EURY|nr:MULTISPECIES: alpha-glucosidase [Haloferax]KAB1194739.1 alpha-glucosidase [Haloferax sp. CBA1148]MRX23321.1 alpha,alpha-phosphotrehalase [Haloferax litoreum]
MTSVPADEERRWWKEAVVYQIYPRSFNDSDGDGVGDIPGIIEKVEYLADLGVDCIWLNPVYESPNADNGYDISDYRAIMDEFGTMADWEELRDALHEHDIRLIMDLVVNHTSDEHAWFVDSRSSRDADKRDYYWWREGRDPEATDLDPDDYDTPADVDEVPPNNWESFFDGPAWTYDDQTGEWYLHLFDRKQPDLNWQNDAVRDDVFEMMEWWLDRGIDGFRMDVINLISKPDGLPDADPEHDVKTIDRAVNGPNIHEYLGEMRDRVLDEDLLTVGEMIGDEMPLETARRYTSQEPGGDGLSMIFHFEHMLLDEGDEAWDVVDWELSDLKVVMDRWQEGLADEGWNSLYLNNHDQPRMVSRFGNDEEYRRESAKLLATLLHTLRGTPYIYQGEELGMTNYPFDSLDEVRDVATLNPLRNAIEAGTIDGFDDVKDIVRVKSRDNARTPMQWDDSEHAGFTDDDPWIPVNPNRDHINVEAERADSASVWHYYRDLISLRKDRDVLVYGDYDQLTPDHESLWAYTRTLETADGDDTLLVVLNFDGDETRFEPPADLASEPAEMLVSNYDADVESVETTTLRPWEARVYDLA